MQRRTMLGIAIILFGLAFAVSCDPEKVVNDYFSKAGLNRLATPRTDIEPGGLVLAGKKGALYTDNMLDYLPTEQQNEYQTLISNEESQYQAVLKKYTQDRGIDAHAALGFVQTFLPLNLDQSLKLTGNVKIDLITAQVARMKIPTVRQFLNSQDSLEFRRAVQEFTPDDKTQAYIIYEVWRTNKLRITTDSGTNIGVDVKVGETKPLELSSGEGKFTYTRTSNTELVIDGDRFYDFAVRTAKLQKGGTPDTYVIVPMNFVPPKDIGIKGTAADESITDSAALNKDFQPLTLQRMTLSELRRQK
jgi:hypothetical protein